MKQSETPDEVQQAITPMRVGIIGCGRRAHEHLNALEALQEYVKVEALCDPDPIAMERARQRVPGAWSGSDPSVLFSQRPCDLVVVCVPPSAPRGQIREALLSAPGLKAVLVEKPAAMDADLAEEAYDGLKVPVFVCHQMRLLPWAKKLREWFQQQPIDATLHLEARCIGKFLDQGIHFLDLAYWLAGSLPPDIDQVTAENNPARLSAEKPLPFKWRVDRSHPGSSWADIRARWNHQRRFRLKAGPLGANDWLEKCLRIEQDGGWLELGVRGIQTGGLLAGCGLEWKAQPGDYEMATTSVYREFFSWILESQNSPDLPSLEEHIDQLIWCENALRDSEIRRLPGPEYLDAPEFEEGAGKLAVIIPLSDHRGLAEKCVKSWTRTQECAPEDFQLILISNENTEIFAEILKPLLRVHDKWIETGKTPARFGQGDMAEYGLGIDETKAEWLFLSEPHCEATPECVREILRFFESSEAAGFCTSCIDGYASPWGKMEGLYYRMGFEEWRQSGHWAKMIMRGFGIRRRVYQQVGGFRLRYGRFSEWLLAADLHRMGLYLDYAPGVEIVHHYSLDKKYLDEAIEEFVIGQARYLGEISLKERLPYFPDVAVEIPSDPEWKALEDIVRPLMPWRWKIMRKEGSLLNPTGKLWMQREWNAFVVEFIAWLNARWAFPFFRKYYEAQILLCMAKHLPEYSQEKEKKALRPGDEWVAEQDVFAELPGFHLFEEWKGYSFRWCKPMSGIYIEPNQHALALEIDLVDVLGEIQPGDVFLAAGDGYHWNVSPMVEDGGKRLRFVLPQMEKTGCIWVALVSQPAPTAKEEIRELGLPIMAIRLVESSPVIPASGNQG
jgi:predicted dehydrogenase